LELRLIGASDAMLQNFSGSAEYSFHDGDRLAVVELVAVLDNAEPPVFLDVRIAWKRRRLGQRDPRPAARKPFIENQIQRYRLVEYCYVKAPSAARPASHVSLQFAVRERSSTRIPRP